MKTQSITHLVHAIGAEDSKMFAVASWTGQQCFDTSGRPVVLWTYGEMLELAQLWLECQTEPTVQVEPTTSGVPAQQYGRSLR